MTRHSQVARRYARALAATLEDHQLQTVAAQLHALGEALASSAELRNVLSNPAIPATRRTELMLLLAEPLEPSPSMVRFLRKMGGNDRLPLLGQVSREFEQIKDERAGKVQAEVSTARPLDPAHREKIRQALSRLTGRGVTMTEKVDPDLIGGVVTRIGSTVYDGSLKSRLVGLKERIHRNS